MPASGWRGCGPGVDCAGGQVDEYRAEMKRLYGKYDLERSFGLLRDRQRGRGTMYHFLKFPDSAGTLVFSEVGAFQVGEFVYCYRATFIEKAGLDDLAKFLGEFRVKKV